MTRLALLHPSGLLATELRESLDRRTDLWQHLSLFSDDEDEVGHLTEVRGEPAVVGPLDGTSLDGIDIAIFAGRMDQTRSLLSQRPAATTALVLSPEATVEDGTPVVAGVNLDDAQADGRVLVSPHPGTILLSHLLFPLRPFAPKQLVANLLQPVSTHGRQGLDEVFEQTRSLLTFSSESPRQVFTAQMSFNVLPVAPQPHIVDHLRTVTGSDFPMSIQVLQMAVFHSYAASLYLQLDEDPGVEALQAALEDHPFIDRAPDPELLGPIDAAARDEVLLGNIEAVPNQPGAYWLWAVMDNLTCGGAVNALNILEALQPSGSAN